MKWTILLIVIGLIMLVCCFVPEKKEKNENTKTD